MGPARQGPALNCKIRQLPTLEDEIRQRIELLGTAKKYATPPEGVEIDERIILLEKSLSYAIAN